MTHPRRIRGLIQPAALLASAGGFLGLYVMAPWFVGSYDLAGLSDQAVRAVAHFTVYGLLAMLLAIALRGLTPLAWLLAVLLATGEELRQLFVPQRFACVEDWLLNVAGITAALIIHALWVWRGRTFVARCLSSTGEADPPEAPAPAGAA